MKMKIILFALFIAIYIQANNSLDIGFDAMKKGEYKTAKIFFEKNCKKNNIDSCYVIGLMYSMGQGVKMDKQKGKQFLKKACSGGDKESCEFINSGYFDK